MTRITRTMHRNRIGLDLHQFQRDLLEAVCDAIEERLPKTSNMFDGENDDRHIHIVAQSFQGVQKGSDPGEFDPVLFVTLNEGFKSTGMICIGWMFLSTKGVMADAIDDAVFDLITEAVRKVGDESDDITVTGAVFADGERVDGSVFMDGTRAPHGETSELLRGLLGMLGKNNEEGQS